MQRGLQSVHSLYRHATYNLIQSCNQESFTSGSVHGSIFKWGRIHQSGHYCWAVFFKLQHKPTQDSYPLRYSPGTSPQTGKSVTAGFCTIVVPPRLKCAPVCAVSGRYMSAVIPHKHCSTCSYKECLKLQDSHEITKRGLLSEIRSSVYRNFNTLCNDFYGKANIFH